MATGLSSVEVELLFTEVVSVESRLSSDLGLPLAQRLAALAELRDMKRRLLMLLTEMRSASPGGSMRASSVADTRLHSCECMCDHCQRNGTGYFAQRAALDGDIAAAAHFAPGIYKTLAAMAAERRAIGACRHRRLRQRRKS